MIFTTWSIMILVFISIGTLLVFSLPSPSWPLLLSPQVNKRPKEVSNDEWSPPKDNFIILSFSSKLKLWLIMVGSELVLEFEAVVFP